MANVLILGGGFGGLVAAEKLSSALGREHQITLVSERRNFVFYPALVQVAFGRLEPEEISFDLQNKMGDAGVRFVESEVIEINSQTHLASVAGEDFTGEIHYDFLVFAFGRRLATEKAPGFFEFAHHLLSVSAAQKFGKAVKDFRRGEIVLGMCPGARLPVPICETAFVLAKQFETEISEKEVSITVVFPETIEDAFGGAQIYEQLDSAFKKHSIKTVENFPVRSISKDKIFTPDGRAMNHNLLMLVPPFQGQGFTKNLSIADESGFIKVNDLMQVAGLPQTYAVGDCVAFSGPKLAHMAVRQASVAAKNIAAEINATPPNEFYYHEIAAIIDQGGEDSIYLHYGIWDDELYRLKKGAMWSWAKNIHDRLWEAKHS